MASEARREGREDKLVVGAGGGRGGGRRGGGTVSAVVSYSKLTGRLLWTLDTAAESSMYG